MTDEEFRFGDRVQFWTLQDCLDFYQKNNPRSPRLSGLSLERLQRSAHWGERGVVYGKAANDILITFDNGEKMSVHPRSLRHLKPLEELVAEVLGEDYL